jgi:hypothetical protein
MPWERGEGTTDQELSKVQSWIEQWDPKLNGGNGSGIGMYLEWQNFKATMRTGILILGFICGVPALLVSLSALGIIHLR